MTTEVKIRYWYLGLLRPKEENEQTFEDEVVTLCIKRGKRFENELKS